MKRLLSLLVTASMVLSFLPAVSFDVSAEEPTDHAQTANPYGSFLVELWEDGAYRTVAAVDAGKFETDFTVQLGQVQNPKIRINKIADGMAILDAVLLDGAAPAAVNGGDAYAYKKLSAKDHDVLELMADGVVLEYSGNGGTLVLTGRIEPEIPGGFPLVFDAQMATDGRAFALTAPYGMDNYGTLTIDGVPDALNVADAFRIYPTVSSWSGHPDGAAYIWVKNDAEYLYVAAEWTGDNTYDYGADFFKVFVDGGDGVHEYIQWSDRGDHGIPAFAYTDLVPHEHMCYELKIPLAELGNPGNIKLGFSLYGTYSGGIWSVVSPYGGGTVSVKNSGNTQLDTIDWGRAVIPEDGTLKLTATAESDYEFICWEIDAVQEFYDGYDWVTLEAEYEFTSGSMRDSDAVIKFDDDVVRTSTYVTITAHFVAVDSWLHADNRAEDFSTIDPAAKTLEISSAAELGLLAAELMIDPECYDEWTINLAADIDLSAHRWQPVPAVGLTFDGGGYEIGGLTVVDYSYDIDHYEDMDTDTRCYGMFSSLYECTVEDIVFVAPGITATDSCKWEQIAAGVVAGSAFASAIRYIEIYDPTVAVNEAGADTSFGIYVGGVVGYTGAKMSGSDVETINIINGADIYGGSITVTSIDYVGEAGTNIGGIAGYNYNSFIGSSAVYQTTIRSYEHDDYIYNSVNIGGIAGVSSTAYTSYGTCLLNNLAIPIFGGDLEGEYCYVGGIAGEVLHDAAVNNLYIGDLYTDDECTEDYEIYCYECNGDVEIEFCSICSHGAFEIVHADGHTVDFNYSYPTVDAFIEDTGIIDTLNDDTAGGGFLTAAQIIRDDMEWGLNYSLSKLRMWEKWESNDFGVAEGTPKLGAYYPLPTYWHDDDIRADNYESIDVDTKTIEIADAAQLGLLAYNLMQDPTKYDMYTVNLTGNDADAFDMSDHRWMPVDMAGVEFMGNNNTISNLRVKDYTEYGAHPDYYYVPNYTAGMFGTLDRCRVNDLTLENPIVEISGESRNYGLYMVGALAGQMLGAKLLNVVIKNPTVSHSQVDNEVAYYGFYMLGGVTGYAQPYAKSKYTVTYDFDNDPINFSVIRGVDVHGGDVSLTLCDDADAVYLGGIAGANFNSVIASSSTNYTELSIDSTDGSSRRLNNGHIGGITGYTSSEYEAYTCLLNNLSMATIAEVPDNIVITTKYIGGVAGVVYEDSVVNNLYIGNLDMFGSLYAGEYTVSNNHVYETVADAWGSDGAYIAALNDDTEDTGGFYKAASILSEDSQGDHGIEEALAMFRVWETYEDSGNDYGYAANTPYLGAYYTPPTYWHVEGATTVPAAVSTANGYVITITEPGQLGAVAAELMLYASAFDDVTIELGDNLDMSDHYWMPVAMVGGIIEGNGHSITRLNVRDRANLGKSVGYRDETVYSAGMFSRLDLTIVRNLTFVAPVINVRESKQYHNVVGVVAGITLNAEIREVIIEEPEVTFTLSGNSAYTIAFIGGVVGHADNGDYKTSVDLDMTIIKSNEVHGGSIKVNLARENKMTEDIYLGGIAGFNYNSYIAASSVNFTDIQVVANDKAGSTNLRVGGITGMTSTFDNGGLGTCLLGNLAIVDFTLPNDSEVSDYHVGGIAGSVVNDSVVNNLYIGNLYVYDHAKNDGMFGNLDKGGFTVSHNYSYPDIATAWGSNGAYVGTLNDATIGGGFYEAAAIINTDTSWGFDKSLSMLRVWKTYGSSGRYAETTPYLGEYYPMPTYWTDDGIRADDFENIDDVAKTIAIANEAELGLLAYNVNDGTDYSGYTITLTADLDLSAHRWTPIGAEYVKPFCGIFDGDNNIISGLTIYSIGNDSIPYQGLFGYVTSGTVKNVIVEDCDITSTGDYIAAVVAGSELSVVENCHVVGGTVSGRDSVGGVVGINTDGTVDGCSNSAAVSSLTDSKVGGIVGMIFKFEEEAIIKNCWNTGAVTGAFYAVGGIAGYNNSATIFNCYNTGNVTGGNEYGSQVGGIVGNNYNGPITNVYNTGTIALNVGAMNDTVGGIVGENSYVGAVVSFAYHLTGCAADDADDNGYGMSTDGGNADGIIVKNAADMKLSAFVTILNGQRGEENTWYLDIKTQNGGYPVLLQPAVPLAKVAGTTLSDTGVATWTDLSDETGLVNYSVQLYKDGSVSGSAKEAASGTTGASFLSEMRAAGVGAYTVVVTAIGNGTTHSDGAASDASSAQSVAKLPTPASLAWSTTNATFNKLADETNVEKYSIAINGAGTVGSVDVAKTGSNLSVAVTSPANGDTFKVKAIAPTTGLWLDSDESAASAVYVAPTYGITLDKSGTETFTAAPYGYGTQSELTVTVTNEGNQPTSALTVALSGTDAASFMLSKTSISSITTVVGADTFTVVPKTGLTAKTHTATITVSGASVASQSFDVSFTVSKAAPTVTFPATATATYGQTLADVLYSGHSGTGLFTWTSGTTTAVGNAGNRTHNMTFTPTDSINYNTAAQNITVAVAQRSISNAVIAAISSQAFTGSSIEPAPVVSDSGATITSGDYDVSYSANTNVGQATVTLTGINNYTGTKTANFNITAAALTGAVTIDGTVRIGEVLTADISGLNTSTVTYSWKRQGGGEVGTASTYAIVAADVGKTLTLTVTATDNYSGTKTATTVAVPYKVVVVAHSSGGDSVAAQTAYKNVGDTVTVAYTIANTAIINELSLGHSITLTSGTSYDYIVTAAHATDGVITLTPVFSHMSELAEADVAITTPVTGAMPQATIASTAYYNGVISWSPTITGTKFLGSTVYTATVTLSAKGGAAFASDFDSFVNGDAATITTASSTSVTFTYQFDVTGTKTATCLDVTPPTKTEYIHGDALDLTGTSVTAHYNDSTSGVVTATFSVENGAALSFGTHNGTTLTATYGGITEDVCVLTVLKTPTVSFVISDITETSATVSFTHSNGTVTTASPWNLSGLTPNTVYSYTLTVTVGGRDFTYPISFRTLPIVPPTGHEVSGEVSDDTATEVVITLERGNTVITTVAATEAPADTFAFSFSGVPDGVYNLVAFNGSHKVTRAITVSGGNITGIMIDMKTGKTQSVVEIANTDTPSAAVDGLPELFDPVNGVCNSDDDDVIIAGGTVEIKLVVEQINEVAVSDDANEIKKVASGKKIDVYIDLSVIKSQYDDQNQLLGEPTKLTNLGTNLLTVTFELPDSLKGKSGITIYRVHNSIAKELPKDAPNADGEYFTIAGGIVTLRVCKFSTYALGYAKALTPYIPPIVDEPKEEIIEPKTELHTAFISGYSDGTFVPDASMTRAEAAQIFYNLLADKGVEITVSFSDVTVEWFARAVNTLASLGVIYGDGDGKFRPNDTITRAELTAIAVRFAQAESVSEVSFTDVSESCWAYNYIAAAVSANWLDGYPDNTFRPYDDIARAEAVKIICRMLGRTPDINDDDITVIFTDVLTTHWAYREIAEASNTHEAQ